MAERLENEKDMAPTHSDPVPTDSDDEDLSLPLTSEIITCMVGTNGKFFKIHKGILARSPVFKQMCTVRFREGLTKQIELPEDDAKTFAVLASWLYKDTITLPFVDSDSAENDQFLLSHVQATVLRNVYIMADKYDLPALQQQALDTMTTSKLTDWSFFEICEQLYTKLSRPDEMLRKFFKNEAVKYLSAPPPPSEGPGDEGEGGEQGDLPHYILSCVRRGDELAEDTLWCLNLVHNSQLLAEQRKVTDLEMLRPRVVQVLTREMRSLYLRHFDIHNEGQAKRYHCKHCLVGYNTDQRAHIAVGKLLQSAGWERNS